MDYASARSSLLATGAVVWAMLAHRGAVAQKRAVIRIGLLSVSLALFAAGVAFDVWRRPGTPPIRTASSAAARAGAGAARRMAPARQRAE